MDNVPFRQNVVSTIESSMLSFLRRRLLIPPVCTTPYDPPWWPRTLELCARVGKDVVW